MTKCENNHRFIQYDKQTACPLCDLIRELEMVERERDELVEKNEELQNEIAWHDDYKSGLL